MMRTPHILEEYGFVKWDGSYTKEMYHVYNPTANKVITFVWPNAGNIGISHNDDDSKLYIDKAMVRMVEQGLPFKINKSETLSVKQFISQFGDGCKQQLDWREKYEYTSKYYNGIPK